MGRGLVAFRRHVDLSDVLGRSADKVVRAANARRVAAVLVVREVTATGAPAGGSGAGLHDLSGQIADALVRAQREVRGG
jgi:hypothetical protein